MSTTKLDDSEFDSAVIKQKQTAAVLFWASWDGGSRAYMPTYEQVAKENQYSLAFYTMDADTTSATAAKYGVRAVPTVLLFKNSQLAGQLTGAATKAKLGTFVNSI